VPGGPLNGTILLKLSKARTFFAKARTIFAKVSRKIGVRIPSIAEEPGFDTATALASVSDAIGKLQKERDKWQRRHTELPRKE
jgi:hypothetical protein